MITPLDIQNKIFKRKLRGYSMKQVDEFLNQVIDGYENLYKDNRDLNDKIRTLSETIAKFSENDETIKRTLLSAQSASDQIQRNANERSDIIIQAAQNKAVEIVSGAHQEVRDLTNRYEELKINMSTYINKMTMLLESQIAVLKDAKLSDRAPAETVAAPPEPAPEKPLYSETIEDLAAAMAQEN